MNKKKRKTHALYSYSNSNVFLYLQYLQYGLCNLYVHTQHSMVSLALSLLLLYTTVLEYKRSSDRRWISGSSRYCIDSIYETSTPYCSTTVLYHTTRAVHAISPTTYLGRARRGIRPAAGRTLAQRVGGKTNLHFESPYRYVLYYSRVQQPCLLKCYGESIFWQGVNQIPISLSLFLSLLRAASSGSLNFARVRLVGYLPDLYRGQLLG